MYNVVANYIQFEVKNADGELVLFILDKNEKSLTSADAERLDLNLAELTQLNREVEIRAKMAELFETDETAREEFEALLVDDHGSAFINFAEARKL
jgi:hypothetical protein